MTNFASPPEHKALATSIALALANVPNVALVNGAVDVKATQRVYNQAARAALKAHGLLTGGKSPGRPVAAFNADVAHAGLALAFAQTAKNGASPLQELLNCACVTLGVPFSDFEKARKLLRAALDSGPFGVVAGVRKFDGYTVQMTAAAPVIAGTPTWARIVETSAAATPASAPATPVASAPPALAVVPSAPAAGKPNPFAAAKAANAKKGK